MHLLIILVICAEEIITLDTNKLLIIMTFYIFFSCYGFAIRARDGVFGGFWWWWVMADLKEGADPVGVDL